MADVDNGTQGKYQWEPKRLSESEILEELSKVEGNAYMMIDPTNFLTPNMGDYLRDSISLEFFKNIEKDLGEDNGNGEQAAFYIESPVINTLGYNADHNVFVIKADYDKKSIDEFDGDTVEFTYGSIKDGGESFTIDGKTYKSFKEYVYLHLPATAGFSSENGLNELTFKVRHIGYDAPEIPHYRTIYIPKNIYEDKDIWGEYTHQKTLSKEEALQASTSFIFNKNTDKATIKFVKVTDGKETTWHEIEKDLTDYNTSPDTVKLYVISSDESPVNLEYHKQAMQAKADMADLLKKAQDIRLVIDAKAYNRVSKEYYDDQDFFEFLKDPVRYWKRVWNGTGMNPYRFFGAAGQELYRRFLGAIYVKIGDAWINAGKYIISRCSMAVLNKEFSNDPLYRENYNFVSEAFKSWTYNPQNQVIVDAVKELSRGTLDNRREIQKAVTGMNFDMFRDHTMMIGDSMFMVPPTAIRVVTQTQNERVPLLRARGSMTKGAPKAERYIEMTLYFNNDTGINGVPYTTILPNGQQITYYMNGLRSLISMFKLTPFLPIENSYINDILNIEAVTLVNMQISTMENYPACIAAVLTLQEFEYRIYMPELPVPDPDKGQDLEMNMFASTINYDVMRWYYQQPIIRGQELAKQIRNGSMSYDSTQYVDATLGQKTSLQPMSFGDSAVEFYTVKKSYLDQQLKLKTEVATAPVVATPPLSDTSKEYAKALGTIYYGIQGAMSSTAFKNMNNSILNSGRDTLWPEGQFGHYKPILNDIFTRYIVGKSSLAYHITVEQNKSANINLVDYLDPERPDWTIAEDVLNLQMRQNPIEWSVYVDIDTSIISVGELENLVATLAAEIGSKPADIYNKGKIKLITYSGYYDTQKNTTNEYIYNMKLNKTDGYTFLMKCAGEREDIKDYDKIEEEGQEWDYSSAKIIEDGLKDRKQAIDVETAASLQFERYPIGDVKIHNVSCVFGNTLTKIGLQAFDGYAPQYAGGQDTVIEISMKTKSEEAVAMIHNLPRLAASYVRDYREVLSCWPIRINSQLTRLLGVNEVMVESVQVDTVPGHPGLFNIGMRLVAVDRTLRNREALKKINDFHNAGSTASSDQTTIETKNYFDLKNALAEAELYPDLELPTLEELRDKAGYNLYIRYANEAKRKYPDPDFYFVYGHVIGSEIFRDIILKFFAENGIEQKFEFTDRDGAKITISPKDLTGFEIIETNARAKKQKDEKGKFEEQAKSAMLHKVDVLNKYQEVNNAVINTNVYKKWDVSDTIRCLFREPQYASALGNKFSTQIDYRAADVIAAIDKELNSKMPFKGFCNPDGFAWSKMYSSDTTWTSSGFHYEMGHEIVGQIGQTKYLEACIKQFVKEYFKNKNGYGRKILSLLSIDNDVIDQTIDGIEKLLKSAAAAATGPKDCDNSGDDWKGRIYRDSNPTIWWSKADVVDGNLIPISIVENHGQGITGRVFAASLDEAMRRGVTFGPFQINTYTKKDAEKLAGTSLNTNQNFFIDPYYMKLQDRYKELLTKYPNNSAPEDVASEIAQLSKDLYEYKFGILMDPYSAAYAFMRNIFFWMKKMIQDNILISLYDLVEDEAIKTINKISAEESRYAAEQAAQATETPGGTPTQKDITSGEQPSGYVPTQKELIDSMNGKNTTTGPVKTQKELEDEFKKAQAAVAAAENVDPATEEEAIQQELNNTRSLAQETLLMMYADKRPLAIGKIFAPMVIALSNGNPGLYDLMRTKNYDALNDLVTNMKSTSGEYMSDIENLDTARKFVLALVGYNMVKSENRIGVKGTNISEKLENYMVEKVYLKAAENPYVYMMHSFYDMVVNDKRGRMLRAFPTFYMMFVDEGREIGIWKLHDNFYNMSAIGEIQVTKSRKIAADTATIVMSNMFKSYTTEDEDQKQPYQYSLKDAYSALFSPRPHFLKEELRRLQAQPVERAKMKPGVRIQLRMGYGADASTLPILFNGVVAEVGTGEVIEIIAQGDGVELSNPILSNTDAEDVQHQDEFIVGKLWNNWITKGATPREILSSLLITNGGWIKKTVKNATNGRFFNDNPYGIVHFGDPKFTDIFKSGECVQNIYEAAGKPSWHEQHGSTLMDEYGMPDAPKISTHIFGKSYWDIMHICASASPDFITSIVPFGMRSSVFYGAPRYYYAYDYDQVETEPGSTIIREKRKPFQQYHLYSSYSDIMANTITASDKDVRTCAVGLYTMNGAVGRKTPKRVGPLWVDFDIYPEKQKTMTVDTQLLAKGTALGDIVPFMNFIQNELADDKGTYQGGYQLAWRMTASALKNSMKDMYQGELIVIGDPSIKPYDKVWIDDIYERMQGCFEAEAVVHTFSVETGYITTILPDCISSIDDRHQQVVHQMGSNILGIAASTYAATVGISYLFAKNTKPILSVISHYINKTGAVANKYLNDTLKFFGQDELLKNEKYLKGSQTFFNAIGINLNNVAFEEFLISASKWRDKLGTLKNVDKMSPKQIADVYDKMSKVLDDTNPAKMIEHFDELYKKGVESGMKQKDLNAIKEALEELKVIDADYKKMITKLDDDFIKAIKSADGINARDVNNILKMFDVYDAGKPKISVVSEYIKSLDVADDGAKSIINVFTKVTTSTHSELKAGLKVVDAVKDSKTIATAGRLAAVAKGSVAALAIGAAIELGVTYLLTAFAYEYVERWMNNLQVLQVFPLKKDGKPYTAGLDGQRGVVVGSPTENDAGMFETMIADLFDNTKGGWIKNTIVPLLASEEMYKTAEKYRKTNGMPEPDSDVNRTSYINSLLQSVMSDEMRTQDLYKAYLMAPRETKLSGDEGKVIFYRYSIQDVEKLGINNDITENMIALPLVKEIASMIQEGKIILAHDTKMKLNEDEEYYTMRRNFMIEGQNKLLPMIYDHGVIDIPFLRPEAYSVLMKIIEVITANSKAEELKEHPIIIQSALRVKDASWTSTGLHFRIQSYKSSLLKEALDEMYEESKVISPETPFFVKSEVNSETFDIMVYPKKVTV